MKTLKEEELRSIGHDVRKVLDNEASLLFEMSAINGQLLCELYEKYPRGFHGVMNQMLFAFFEANSFSIEEGIEELTKMLKQFEIAVKAAIEGNS